MKKVLFILLLATISSGCRDKDRNFQANYPRLITFSPALTKITFDMGLGSHIVGVTTFCQVPAGQKRPLIGNSLNVRVEPILAVQPDIIVTQTDVKNFEPVIRVNSRIRVEKIVIETLAEIAHAMEQIGRIVNQPDVGKLTGKNFLKKINQIKQKTSQLPKRRVFFVLGYQNFSGPGRETFLDEMISLAGGINIMSKNYTGWKKISLETVISLDPDVIICQCESLQRKQALAFWNNFAPDKPVFVVTDRYWTIPAGHLADYAAKLMDMIHQEQAKQGD